MCLKLKQYSDDGHGWTAVKLTTLLKLGIVDLISSYSYQSETGSTVYLEEDLDTGILIKALLESNVLYEVNHVRHNGQSRIRSLPRYSNKSLK